MFIVQTGAPDLLSAAGYMLTSAVQMQLLVVPGTRARGTVQAASTWTVRSLPMTRGKELTLTGELGQTALAWLFCIPLPFNLATSRREQGAVSKAELKSAVDPSGLNLGRLH